MTFGFGALLFEPYPRGGARQRSQIAYRNDADLCRATSSAQRQHVTALRFVVHRPRSSSAPHSAVALGVGRAWTAGGLRVRHSSHVTYRHSLAAGQGTPVTPQAAGVRPSNTVEKWMTTL
jgi:hypothetical protein